MSTALVVSLNQAAINGIRAAGAKQVINVEGNGKLHHLSCQSKIFPATVQSWEVLS
jgi:hypothetical protein